MWLNLFFHEFNFNFTFQEPDIKKADTETDEDIDVETVENIDVETVENIDVETVENVDVEHVNIDDKLKNNDAEKQEETKAKIDIKSLKEIHTI